MRVLEKSQMAQVSGGDISDGLQADLTKTAATVQGWFDMATSTSVTELWNAVPVAEGTGAAEAAAVRAITLGATKAVGGMVVGAATTGYAAGTLWVENTESGAAAVDWVEQHVVEPIAEALGAEPLPHDEPDIEVRTGTGTVVNGDGSTHTWDYIFINGTDVAHPGGTGTDYGD